MESEEIARSHILLSKYTACILTYHLKRKGTDCCKEIVLKAVRKNGYALEYASLELQNDKQIVLEAVKHSIEIFKFASNELKSDKKFVFVTHNDVLYTGDVIGDMLNKINDSIGIGQIGQCWNCPAHRANLCSGEKFYDWNPTYDEVISLGLPYVRTNIRNVDKTNPKPLPECRLNEWACLINREMSNKETYPNGDTPLFGVFGPDSGVAWFRSLHLKGYKFVNYSEKYTHSYWSELPNGYQTSLNNDYYVRAEETAKKYFMENFN
jgi:hypothetical protein